MVAVGILRCGSDREEARVGGVLPAAAKPGCLHPLLTPALFLRKGQDGIFLVPVASLQSPTSH